MVWNYCISNVYQTAGPRRALSTPVLPPGDSLSVYAQWDRQTKKHKDIRPVVFDQSNTCTHMHSHTRLTVFCPGLHRWAITRKVRPIWISLKQETVSGSGISWAICKSAPRSRQITTPAPHHSVFYRPDALPATQPTASMHWPEY